MRRNVLHILGTAGSEGTGIARQVSAVTRSLDPDRYKVHVWFLAGDGPLASELRTAGARVSVFDWSCSAGDPVGAWRCWREIYSGHFAIIHQHFGGRFLRWLARGATRAKIINHRHAFESRDVKSPVLWAGADFVIATSRAVADCVSGAHARVVYPGVDIPEAGNCGSISGRMKDEIVVGTAGRLVPEKGIVHLIRALTVLCREFPNFSLEIAGSGPEQAALESEVQSHKLADRVRLLGWRTELAPLMAGWDLYVQPSLREPFGIAALEAMAASLPVVATLGAGLSELVEHGKTGWLVPPSDPAALADRLRVMLIDQSGRHRMGDAGRLRAQESFSTDRMTTAVSSIYDDLLSGREAQSG
jgi:glycosyltransferase involved in cell wall biosynthesis